MAPTNFTSPKPMASFFSTASATRAIQSTTPEPATRPTSAARARAQAVQQVEIPCSPCSDGTSAAGAALRGEADREGVGYDHVVEVDERPADERAEEHPAADGGGRRQAKPAGEEQGAGQELDERIARREGRPQQRARPRRRSQERMGMLSYHAIGAPQAQAEPGRTMERPAGTR